MVALGMYFIFITLLGLFFMLEGTLLAKKWYLKILTWSIPLPILAIELGWVTAEVGRQPWAVYKMLRTSDAVSVTVTSGEILASIVMFALIYLLLGAVYLFLMMKEVRHGFPEQTRGEG